LVKPICKDVFFLRMPGKPATKADIHIATDLIDTYKTHIDNCVGMAANMIGYDKRIIIVNNNGQLLVMFNPEIIRQSEPYETEEGCLSLTGKRPVTRYKSITVRYQDMDFQWKTGFYFGWTAQIIQHEVDHCNGKVI